MADDYNLSDDSKKRLTRLSRSLLKAEESFKIVLVGRSHTSGDLAYQNRLVQRRFDGITQALIKESIKQSRILSFISNQDNVRIGLDTTQSSGQNVEIYLIKE